MGRPKTVVDGEPANLNLPRKVKNTARRLALERYGIPLQELVARLLVKEIRHPKGLCFSRPRELTPETT